MSSTFTFSGQKSDEFNGVFTTLSNSGSIDIFPSLIEVTESSFFNSNHKGFHAITNKWDIGSLWHSTIGISQWLQIDFKESVFQVSSYSIKSHSGVSQFRNYEFKASNDLDSWTVLHSLNNVDNFCPGLVSQNFPISNPNSFRYFRFQSTGLSCNSGQFLIIQDLEFFGTLNPENPSTTNSIEYCIITCKFPNMFNIFNIFIIYIEHFALASID